jgi:hypothetical protein
MNENVTPRQLQAIESLLTHGDVTAAAVAAGVTRKTVHHWLKQPAFSLALRTSEQAVLESLTRRLVQLGTKAANVLDAAMESGAPMAVRVRAADAVLSRLLQLHERVILEQRVAELEAQSAGREQGRGY